MKPNKSKTARKAKSPKKLRLIPLGGLGEVGKNMLVLEYGEDMILVDAGLMFPEEEMLGIDLVLPDFSYVVNNASRLRAIIITHGHEDHTGALPYLLKEVRAPVYATRLTLGLIKGKLGEHRLKGLELKEIDCDKELRIKNFHIRFLRVCHSIPDGVGLAITTPVGTILHSGDFKFDATPIDGRLTEFEKFASYKGKVLALLSDSTNAEIAGYTGSEREVGEGLRDIFTNAKGRIIFASFASHIHRIQQVMTMAELAKRKVAICGLNMLRNTEIADELGYLKIPDGLMINPADMKKYPRREVVVISTGSQGEPLSALAKMASHDHKYVDIQAGDTVIVSASPIPGNEKSISNVIDRLFQRGAEVHYQSVSGVHVSGHGAQEELKLMLTLVKPDYFVPIHGEHRHLVYHSQLAMEVGIPKERILLLENGNIVEFDGQGAKVTGKVRAGVIFVDGLGVGDIGSIVLRDRQQLANDGIFVVVVTVDQQTGRLVQDPDVISRGFVYLKEASGLVEEAKATVQETLKATAREEITDWGVLKSKVHNVLSKLLYDRTKRRPMIIPIIIEL